LRLERYDISGLGTLRTLGNIELDALTFAKIAEAITHNGAEMYENVISGFARNEAEAFIRVKPFYGTLFFRHGLELLS